ncbi:MAG: hypothetical protein ABSF83_12445 [Nitrososphaerales archaeon]|jgi:hypothetical protein
MPRGAGEGAAAVASLVFLLLPLLFLLPASGALPPAAGSGGAPSLVPTHVCACQPSDADPPQFKGPPVPPSGSTAYDEQIGTTFTQSFTSMEYNVTAVEQTDASLGTGPGYLLNGLANTGYWYQVGLSWNWSPGDRVGTGFDMNYEVFDPSQNSVFPADGGGGLQAFSGTVNPGDLVTLNLYFGSGQVVMLAKDTSTGASASVTYGAFGGTYFAGSTGSPANSNGFFTGLMDEWYHGQPFYQNGRQVVFSNPGSAVSSAWMWMDEFDASNLKALFSANTPSPVSYGGDPTTLQEFSYNGTVEYGDAYEFVTGNLTGSVTPQGVPLTFSYSVAGGGSGYQPPVLTYVSGGATKTAELNSSAVAYQADAGTTWTVTSVLAGSTSSERWETDQDATGVVHSAETVEFQYYHQFLVSFGFGVSGGGSGYSSPTVTAVSFGSPRTMGGASASFPLAAAWVDAGSRYNYTDPLPGSSSSERWESDPSAGSVYSAGPVTVEYYHQYLVEAVTSFTGSEIFPSVTLRSNSTGSPVQETLAEGTTSFWLDSGARYSVSQAVSLSPGERWETNATTSGVVTGRLDIPLAYQYQYLVTVGTNAAEGGTASSGSGWYAPGTTLQVTAAPNSGWEAEGWTGEGPDASSSQSPVLSLVVTGPANETAVFYPGVTISSAGPVSVSYQDGSVSGTVPAGKTSMVYVPPSSTISLTASPTPLLYSFEGWRGAVTSSGASVSLRVSGPASATAESGYDLTGVLAVVLAVVLIGLGALLVVRRSRVRSDARRDDGSGGAGEGKETVGSPAA